MFDILPLMFALVAFLVGINAIASSTTATVTVVIAIAGLVLWTGSSSISVQEKARAKLARRHRGKKETRLDELNILLLLVIRAGLKPVLVTGKVRKSEKLYNDLVAQFPNTYFIIISQDLEGVMGTQRTYDDIVNLGLKRDGITVIVNTGNSTCQAQCYTPDGDRLGELIELKYGFNNALDNTVFNQMVVDIRGTHPSQHINWVITGSAWYVADEQFPHTRVADKAMATDVQYCAASEMKGFVSSLTQIPTDNVLIIRTLCEQVIDADGNSRTVALKPSPIPHVVDEDGCIVQVIIGDFGGGKYADVDSHGNAVKGSELNFKKLGLPDYDTDADHWNTLMKDHFPSVFGDSGVATDTE